MSPTEIIHHCRVRVLELADQAGNVAETRRCSASPARPLSVANLARELLQTKVKSECRETSPSITARRHA